MIERPIFQIKIVSFVAVSVGGCLQYYRFENVRICETILFHTLGVLSFVGSRAWSRGRRQ